MKEVYLNMPQIPAEDFLTIFLSGGFVILFGAIFVAFFTLAKMKKIPGYYIYVGYLFWAAQTYSLYLLSTLIGSGEFTKKVLMLAMLGYLILPHFVYFLMDRTHEGYEH